MNDTIIAYRKQIVKYNDLMTEHVKMLDALNSEYKAKFKRSDFWKLMFVTDFIWMNAGLLLIFIYMYISGKETFIESLIITYLLLMLIINVFLIICLGINRHKNKKNRDKYKVLCNSCEKRRIEANKYLHEASENAIELILIDINRNSFIKSRDDLISEIKEANPNIDGEVAICEYYNKYTKEKNDEVPIEMSEEEKRKLMELKERLYK